VNGVSSVALPQKSGVFQYYAAASVSNYRDIYKTLRSDPVIQKVHERYPFILMWDDHEFSNDCWQSNATYENGRIFAVNFDGLLQSFAEDSGQIQWSVQLPIQWSFTAPPTAYQGRVYVGGAGDGGTLYAVDEQTGALDWSTMVNFGDNSSPAVGDGGIYVTYPCLYYKIDPVTGAQIWKYDGGCDGGGGKTPVYYNGRVYVRDPSNGDAIIDANSGTLVGMLSTSAPPSFYRDPSSGKLPD